MTFKTIEFTSGHKLVDNGVGDYRLECPTKGDAGFLHMGQVMQVTTRSCWCNTCDGKIGAQIDPSLTPYTLETVKLSDVVTDLCERAGLEPDEEAIRQLDQEHPAQFVPAIEPDICPGATCEKGED